MKRLSEYCLKLALCAILSILFNMGKLHAQDAQIWRRFTGEINNSNIPVLPNYGYAGYKLGKEAIPETHPHPVFDVTDYGAVPNDANSDEAAIEAAIAAAEANGSGVVFFPPGEFLVNTDPNNDNTSILIQSSNIILKGSGSTPGGTIINMKNHMMVQPGDIQSGRTMFAFTFPKTQGTLTHLAQNASRGDNFITVQDASVFAGYKFCRLNLPNNTAANSQFLDGRSTQSAWTNINTNGVGCAERHEIESVDIPSNRVYLKDPITDNMTASHVWEVRGVSLMEGSGFEDIHFKANFTDNFVHHQDYIHNSGWGALSMNRVAHSWIRRVRFSNVTNGIKIGKSYATSAIMVLVDGNRGHGTAAIGGGANRILIGLLWDNTNNGQWHGPGFSQQANGSVVWRVDATKGRGYDTHANLPRTNLFDLYNSVDLTGSGGWSGNLPHHLTGLTIWNQKRVGGSSVNNYNVWGDGWWLASPIIVGYHGTNTTFTQSSLKYQESNGTKVSPESLYEAQVEHNLGFKPAWIDAAIAEYNALKTGWYSSVPSGPPSVALNKPASQSSTDWGGVASRAVDGNTNGVFSQGSVTHTDRAGEADPWWQVDLESVYDITDIKVYNRTDACCADRLANYHVFVSDDPFTSTNLNTTINQSGVGNFFQSAQAGTPTTIAVNRSGRYVRVQLAGTNKLSIAEVHITGTSGGPSTVSVTGVSVSPTSFSLDEGQTSDLTETVSPSNATDKTVSWSSNNTSVATVNSSGLVTAVSAGSATITATTTDGGFTATSTVTVTAAPTPTNVALNKPASQSSTDWGGVAGRAVDGNTNGVFNNGSVTHTDRAGEASPWWEVDLENVHNITDIKIYNRTDTCCADRLTNYHVFVSDNAFTSTNLNTTINQSGVGNFFQSAQAGTPTTIAINRSGRYVRVQLAGTNKLSIAELEVMGTPGSGVRVSSAKVDPEGEYVSSALSIYPSPVGQGRVLNIDFSTDLFEDKLELVLTNLSGQNVLDRVFELKHGTNHIALETAGLKQGVYIMKLISSEKSTSRKILIKGE